VTLEVLLGAQAHEVGIGGRLEPALHDEVVVGAAPDPPGSWGADPEVEDRYVVLRVVGLAPDLDERAETEGLGTVLDHHRHAVHGSSVPERWQ